MNPDSLKYLQDILDSIDRIESNIRETKTLAEYSNNNTIIDAVERRLAIIGEALWKASKLEPEISVTNQKKIIALRPILIHDYDLIDDASIWKIVRINLKILKDEVTQLLF